MAYLEGGVAGEVVHRVGVLAGSNPFRRPWIREDVALLDAVVVGGVGELSGRTPKFARFCQWMRAKHLAITARSPR